MNERFVRLGGWGLATASVVYAFAEVVRTLLGETNASPVAVAVGLIGVVAASVIALTLAVIPAVHRGRAPIWTGVGYVCLGFAVMETGVAEGLMGTFLVPFLSAKGLLNSVPFGLIAVFMLTALVSVIGSGCLGAAMLRARCFSRWAPAGLLAAALLGVVGIALNLPRGPVGAGVVALLFSGLAVAGFQAAIGRERRPSEAHAVAPSPA